jgi:UDP-3-O-[3-hydroxymyristoyl] glucosamine N-acyltransferase
MELIHLDIIKKKIINNGYFDSLGHSVVKHIQNLLTFCDQVEYVETIINNKNISSVIIKPEFIDYFKNYKIGIVISDDPRMDFFKIHNFLGLKFPNFDSIIGDNNNIHESCIISKSNVVIGNNCIIEPHVVINSNVEVGDDVIIRAGSIIGGQGFQFWKNTSEVLKIKHNGKTIIQNNVEVKELCTIHSAVFDWDSTIIGEFTKIDAHTHIGHSNKIGRKVYLCSHSNISGNSIIEDECYIGPGVNIPNRLKVGFKAKLTVGATITNDIMKETTVSGNFAIPHDIYIKHIKSLMK